jgi:cytochrome P450
VSAHATTVSPAFSPSNVAGFAGIFLDKTNILRDIWMEDLARAEKDELRMDVSPSLSRCTLDIIGSAGMDYEFDVMRNSETPLAKAFNELLCVSCRLSMPALIQPTASNHSPLASSSKYCSCYSRSYPSFRTCPPSAPGSSRGKCFPGRQPPSDAPSRAMGMMEAEGRKIIAKKRQQADSDQQQKDLISLLMQANTAAENEKAKMSDVEIMGQLTTFLLAVRSGGSVWAVLMVAQGHETTATAATWALHHLSLNKPAQDRLRAELREAKAKSGTDLDGETISSLTYLDAVTREVLRVSSPVGSTVRESSKDDFIPLARPVTLKNGKQADSVFVKAGTTLFIPIVVVNHSKDIWGDNAEEFVRGCSRRWTHLTCGRYRNDGWASWIPKFWRRPRATRFGARC